MMLNFPNDALSNKKSTYVKNVFVNFLFSCVNSLKQINHTPLYKKTHLKSSNNDYSRDLSLLHKFRNYFEKEILNAEDMSEFVDLFKVNTSNMKTAEIFNLRDKLIELEKRICNLENIIGN